MNIKKIVLRTVPYVCIALYGTKIGRILSFGFSDRDSAVGFYVQPG